MITISLLTSSFRSNKNPAIFCDRAKKICSKYVPLSEIVSFLRRKIKPIYRCSILEKLERSALIFSLLLFILLHLFLNISSTYCRVEINKQRQ